MISRGFAALFFQVRPTDLSIYLIVAVLLAAIGLLAATVPARRASRVDPIVSLRSDLTPRRRCGMAVEAMRLVWTLRRGVDSS